MPVAQSLANLRLEAQQRANQESKTLVATTEWNRYANEAIAELYDLVIAANPHYYVSQAGFTLAATNTFDLTTLSSGFYKLRGIDYLPSGPQYPVSVRPLNFQERNRFWNQNFAGNYTIWWTPPPPVLVNDTDVLDYILNTWSEFVAITMAIAAAVKEESMELASALGAQREKVETRVKNAAVNRSGEPEQAADLTLSYARGDSARRFMMEGNNLIIQGSTYSPWAF